MILRSAVPTPPKPPSNYYYKQIYIKKYVNNVLRGTNNLNITLAQQKRLVNTAASLYDIIKEVR